MKENITPRKFEDLPLPPNGKTGWPWTGGAGYQSESESATLPAISIVTPNFNGGEFLEATIRSVLLQGYPHLEYIIVDGGSTDGSLEIIHRYEPWLSGWLSEPDTGMYDAVNKGFDHTSGGIMAWLNSDDMYVPNSLRQVGACFGQCGPDVKWLKGMSGVWNIRGDFCWISDLKRFHQGLIQRGCYEGRGLGWIQQESVFWRRGLWEKAGGYISDEYRLAGDFELWTRFARYAELYSVRNVFSGIRRHPDQRSAAMEDYRKEVDECLLGMPDRGRIARLCRRPVARKIFQFTAKRLFKAPIIEYDPLALCWKAYRL